MKSINQEDTIFKLADSFVNQTSCNIFLTGKAGSGKTTFLHYITRHTAKNFVVVAPTGVAALNAGGMTIHSFFQLPIGMFIPETRTLGFQIFLQAVYTHAALLKKIRINKQKRKLIKQLELLIIDEVSMVRADVLDAIDVVLKYIRKNYKQAFGGVQILMIGDLYQLPPVVTEHDKDLLFKYYESPYFFSARVIKKSPPVRLELEKIFRQSDKEFIGLLNKIRRNQMNDADLKWLNDFYNPKFIPPESEKYITLCSHHYKANAINDHEIKQLSGKLYRFEAEIEGDFNESAAPADQILILKKGAQIMFIKNDTGEEKRYYNGKIGVISEIDEEEIGVTFPGEEGTLFLEKEVWRNIRYTLEDTSDTITEKELGTFCQFPIRLAWAITIHKSQGLTFDRAMIDAGDSFTSGQVYVALSRLRGIKGLVLRTPIEKGSIINDWQVQDQYHPQDREELQELLEVEQKNYLRTILLKSMDWDSFMNTFSDFVEEYKERQVVYQDEAMKLGNLCLEKGKELKEVGRKFDTQVSKFYAAGSQAYPILSERMQAAFDYFNKNLKEHVYDPITDHYHQMQHKTRMRKYLKALQSLQQAAAIRIQEIKQARDLALGLEKGEKISNLISSLNDNRKKFTLTPITLVKVKKPQKRDSKKMSFEMYRLGKSVDEIARERRLHPGTIESHLLHFIREGELDVYVLISEENYKALYPKLVKRPFRSLSQIKYELGNQFSYTEIRAVLNHMDYLKRNTD